MSMSIKHRTETPNIPYGPATGVPTPEPHNEVLSTGPDHEYRKDSTPGTADHAEPKHVQSGPGVGIPKGAGHPVNGTVVAGFTPTSAKGNKDKDQKHGPGAK